MGNIREDRRVKIPDIRDTDGRILHPFKFLWQGRFVCWQWGVNKNDALRRIKARLRGKVKCL